MTKKVKCQLVSNLKNKNVRVRVIKAPLVDNNDLKMIISARTKALVI